MRRCFQSPICDSGRVKTHASHLTTSEMSLCLLHCLFVFFSERRIFQEIQEAYFQHNMSAVMLCYSFEVWGTLEETGQRGSECGGHSTMLGSSLGFMVRLTWIEIPLWTSSSCRILGKFLISMPSNVNNCTCEGERNNTHGCAQLTPDTEPCP